MATVCQRCAPYVHFMTEDQSEEPNVPGLHDVLADAREVVLHWREAYAHLRVVPSDGAEAKGLRTEMQLLRDEYARLIEEARHFGRERVERAPISEPTPLRGLRERDA